MIEVSTLDGILAIIDNIGDITSGTNFYTKWTEPIQVGTFQYSKGKELRAHRHIMRHGLSSTRTQEIMIVFSGRVLVNIFDEKDKFVESHYLLPGDFFIQFQGGCSYTILEDARMMEVKTGPCYGDDIDRVLIKGT